GEGVVVDGEGAHRVARDRHARGVEQPEHGIGDIVATWRVRRVLRRCGPRLLACDREDVVAHEPTDDVLEVTAGTADVAGRHARVPERVRRPLRLTLPSRVVRQGDVAGTGHAHGEPVIAVLATVEAVGEHHTGEGA